jgi:hypothetical protein
MTWYDNQGHVKATALPEAVTGTAGTGLLAPAGGKQWANQSRSTYDELSRVKQDTFYGVNGDSTAIVQRWEHHHPLRLQRHLRHATHGRAHPDHQRRLRHRHQRHQARAVHRSLPSGRSA